MTEDQKKEAVSKHFLRVLAEGHGFKTQELAQDHGVDMLVWPVSVRETPHGGVRYLDMPYKLEFQLKSTTTTGVIDEGDEIKYDLEVKNYNDLIHRRSEPLPLHLVLVVLDAAPPLCINIDADRLGLHGKAYWYLPDVGAAESANKTQIRISIPKTNQLQSEFVRSRFEDLGIEL